MRWDALFADLQVQFAAAEQRKLDQEISERAKVEASAIGLPDRLRASIGREVSITVKPELRFSGTLGFVGLDWVLINTPAHSAIIPLRAMMSIEGLTRLALSPSSRIQQSLSSAIRALASSRAEVTLCLSGADGVPGTLSGVIVRVGADHCDLLQLPDRDSFPETERKKLSVPFRAVLAVASWQVEARWRL
ncbi:hypothetical protein [Psychromicrobium sp. YIM B11713]|uniref:hypothetical protein n=1 Tax=Psychromicrobium sp. YIM B11713 TaxID=3145233 RepID=UPI00374F1089